MSVDTSSISFSLESFVIAVSTLAVPRCQGCLSAKPHMHCFPFLSTIAFSLIHRAFNLFRSENFILFLWHRMIRKAWLEKSKTKRAATFSVYHIYKLLRSDPQNHEAKLGRRISIDKLRCFRNSPNIELSQHCFLHQI